MKKKMMICGLTNFEKRTKENKMRLNRSIHFCVLLEILAHKFFEISMERKTIADTYKLAYIKTN